MKVLLVEDDEALASVIVRALRGEGFAIDRVRDGESALDLLAYTPYDVVLLDRGLPGIGGDEVCRRLSEETTRPRILMVTAADDVHERVAGLELGADDYLPKPFALAELVARVRALGRRPLAALPPVLERAGIRLDTNRRRVFRAGRDVALTNKEFGVLEALLRADGAVVSAETLLEQVWDQNADPFTNAVRITVMTLRRKLADPPVIGTVPGVGYRIE